MPGISHNLVDNLIETEPETILVDVHIAYEGWLNQLPWGTPIGSIGSHNQIEAIRIHPCGNDRHVEYEVYTDAKKWIRANDGAIAGTVGKSKPVKGFSLRLTGKYDCDVY